VKNQKRMRSNVQGAFDRIRAKCVYVVGAMRSTVQGTFERICAGMCV
jgi:hypothetical protein